MNTELFESLLDFLPGCSPEILSTSLPADTSFFAIAARFANQAGTVVLASGGHSDCARYNILGINPWLTLTTTLTHATVATNGATATIETDPLEILDYIVRRFRLPEAKYPLPLCSGLLGYLSYDLKDCIETLPRTSIDDLHLPHLYMVAPSIILIDDLLDKKRTVYISPIAGDAKERKEAFEKAINAPLPEQPPQPISHSGMTSCFTRHKYMHAIDVIRDYIVRGHVYQVNMSQRFETVFTGDTFELFTSLFQRNPAPFFAYVNAGDHQIVSTSPERFIELRGKSVETRPIKGTRPRGKTPEEDNQQRRSLENSTKDDAELSMIVDLLRNDIGKVCSAGSVKVREHKRVEAYENVFHLVSTIDGVLDDNRSAVDLIRATFPGGSITGCPKIRSMEIIDELEPIRRHLYTGSIGYIGFHDTMDLSIAIRTATIKGNRLVFSVGGGVVFDSVPAEEFDETLHKGRTLTNAFGEATVQQPAPSPVAWYNGTFLPIEEIAISAQDEGFLYGYGIFETIRVDRGKPCHLPAHLERFNHSWRFSFGTEPPDITWETVITQVVDLCGLGCSVAAVKLLATAGTIATPALPTLLVTARPYTHRLKVLNKNGLHLVTYPHHRYSHLSSHKTMNYMFLKMANDWARKKGADEAIILNTDGSIAETATANILCIINGTWFRPKSAYVLPGTMEHEVCTVLAKQGTPVEIKTLSIDEIVSADHVFCTNALMGIVPVLQIDTTPIRGDGTAICADINSLVL